MKKTFHIDGMHCAGCVANVEKSLKKVRGVKDAVVNLTLKNATIEMAEEIPLSPIKQALKKAGYTLVEDPTESLEQQQTKEIILWKKRLLWMSILGVPLLIFAMWEMFLYMPLPQWMVILIQFVLATPIVLIGREYYVLGFKSLFYRTPNMNSLVALGTGAAYVYSLVSSVNMIIGLHIPGFEKLYFESAGVILLFITLGRWLEARARGRTTEALSALLNTAPKTGLVERGGQWVEIPVDDIQVGDRIRIKPGKQIPVDGVVVEGQTHIDESAITGESVPVEKLAGDFVTGATMNTTGSIIIRAQKVGEDTMYARIIRMVREAQGSKAPIQAMADRIAAVFVPLVLGLAVIGFFAWFALGHSLVFAMNIFISVLIIACPCALGLATPTAMVVGTGMAARLGIHFKSAESLERLSGVDTVIFDKTGTLTTGRSSVTNVVPDENNEEFLSILQSLEVHSEHHIAAAIVSFLENRNLPLYEVDAFEAVSGLGVRGIIDGKITRAGSIDYLKREDVDIPPHAEKCDDKFRSQGKTVVHVSSGKQWLGLVAVSDEIRIETEQVVYDLQSRGIETWMITGDNTKTAEIVGKTIGIKNIMAEILPEDKSNKVKELKRMGKKVAMVGDGINDAPALATADVGISISTGTDVAIETADVVLMRPELTGVKIALALSRSVVRKIRQNLFWAFIYNIVGIPVALGLLYPFTGYLLSPMIAGAAMAFSSVSVVSNTLLLKKRRF